MNLFDKYDRQEVEAVHELSSAAEPEEEAAEGGSAIAPVHKPLPLTDVTNLWSGCKFQVPHLDAGDL